MGESSGRPDERGLEELFLGGEMRYTRAEASRRAGVDPDFAHRIWRAMGFADLPEGDVALTDGDVQALRIAGEQLRLGIVDEEAAVRVARAMGQAMARLAESEIDIITQLMFEPGKPLTDDEVSGLLKYVEEMLPAMEPLIVQVWRRQIAASGTRTMAVAAANQDMPLTSGPLGVGFADIVSFTEISRSLDETELARLVEGFEAVASDIISAHRGRLVKTLGDEVLFTADNPAALTEIGLELAEAMDTPRVRVGLAYGPVLPIMGDVFGTTVNLASRITAMARPGAVLADTGLAEELADDPAYRVVRILRRPARGLGIIQPHVIRRSERRTAHTPRR
jgi:adenylate cyclase